jgi:hypothetical protein
VGVVNRVGVVIGAAHTQDDDVESHGGSSKVITEPLCCFFANPTLPGPRLRTLYLGLARTIYIWCIYNIFGREITKYTVIYGAYIRFWPTLVISDNTLILSHVLTFALFISP